MTSPSLLDRLAGSRNKPSILSLSLTSNPKRSPSEYDLDELEPRPDDTFIEQKSQGARLRKPGHAGPPMRPSPADSWDDRPSSVGSTSKIMPRPLFAGPPPPIASSNLLDHGSSASTSSRQPSQTSHISLVDSRPHNGGSFLDRQRRETPNRPDSIWRGLKRQEKALEREIQQLLDLQASGLVAGSTDLDALPQSEIDGYSEAGSSLFYSTATSRSRMINSLHVPVRSTPEGNVIPIRQPSPTKPMKLRSIRVGLKKSMAALSQLKADEDAHVEAAIAQRKDALAYLKKMGNKRESIYAELRALEDDEQEPLGRELRELGSEHDTLTHEIYALEEKLVCMRNRRRWLHEKMDDVKNKREAGLSGYRAAGRDIDAEVHALMHRPPIEPLDQEVLDNNGREDETFEDPGGVEFLRLRPERRTVEMAMTWWESEVRVLERRKAQIVADRQALEEGAAIWNEVTTLVAGFESSLHGVVKADSGSGSKVPLESASPEATMRGQVDRMGKVISELEQRMQLAEEKHWNLLICAIGAELEAFIKARRILKSTVEPLIDDQLPSPTSVKGKETSNDVPDEERHDESDNEVPPDLLISDVDDHEHGDLVGSNRPVHGRRNSENNAVPPEFLAEHLGEKKEV